MNKKIIIALIFVFVITLVPNTIFAAKKVVINKETLNESFQELIEEMEPEEEVDITVYDDYILMKEGEKETRATYSINGDKIKFKSEIDFVSGITYDEYEKECDRLGLPILGCAAVTRMVGMDYFTTLWYLVAMAFNSDEMSTTPSYIILYDGTTSYNGEYTPIYVDQFPNKTIEYIKILRQNDIYLSDKDSYNFVTLSEKLTNVTNTSATLTREIEVNTKNLIEAFRFSDVEPGTWYFEAVQYCYNNGIILGTSDTTFEPNTKLTRGMLVTILYRMEGSPKITGKNKFSDVASGKYYHNAVVWAEQSGIVNGYKGTTKFGPTDNIKRQDLACMLSNYANFKGKYVKSNYGLDKFSDSSKVSTYALPAIKWSVKNNIINGSNGKLNPKGTATRAEAAAMLYNYCLNIK